MNALRELQSIRTKQGSHRTKIKVLEKKADGLLAISLKAKIRTKGTLGAVTWTFGCEENYPNKLNVKPHADNGKSDLGYINTFYGTDISRAEVIKLRDFLNRFLEWSE